ncbi:TonB-dependent receptor [Marinomonas aquiplantarum]|uniref:TonB-dependent receptor-like protein n=1 Tax=Marinomonas aquiplantarum TaxID=491951 RepID=A0A366CWG2_9GAMM|nr:secretin and TonB N-terminal domain-containing protein [Marinomonas aquiplantarum]RBO80022.1 TonB-dependent receptor-like protein [Marinomonas aquiplantarum]
MLTCHSFRCVKQRTTPTLLALSIGLVTGSFSFIVPNSAFAASVINEHTFYRIPEGSLEKALNQFAVTSGWFIGGNAQLTRGKRTNGIEGQYSHSQALDLLLSGTGLSYQEGTGNSLVLVDANSVTQTSDGIELSPILINDTKDTTKIGEKTIRSTEIESMAGESTNLTDLLKGNAAARFSLSSSNSASSASMRPDEVSIHGQAHYQNAYIIDGISANNDLNPGDSEDTYSNPINPANLSMLSGSSSQSFYVDPAILESVTIYDSNVPAAFGGFLGGVISSEIKRYDGEDYFSWKYKLSRDEFDEMHFDESLEEDMAEGDSIEGEYTPDYLKQRYTLSGAQGLGEKAGMTYSFSRGVSRFAQSYVKNIGNTVYDKQGVEYDDTVDNLAARLDVKATSDLNFGASVIYSNRYHDGVTNASYDSAFVKSHKATGVSLDAVYQAEKGVLTSLLSYSKAQDTLASDDSSYVYHPADRTNGDWPYSGGYGDINQQQDTTAVGLDWLQKAFVVGDFQHTLHLGVELSHIKQFYEVEGDIISQTYRCISGSSSCADANSDGVVDYDDEYLFIQSETAANKLEKSYLAYGAFVEDTIEHKDWTYYLGLRADYNTSLENLDISPRASATWDIFSNQQTYLITGANRYYGRDFFRYEVNSQLRSWRTMYRYNSDGSLNRVTNYSDDSFYQYDLDTPYSDELVLGVSQKLGNVNATLKWVRRDSQDLVTRTENDTGDYYTNEGESLTETLSLSFETLKPFEFAGTQTYGGFSISYQESETNVLSDVSYEDEISSDSIYYHGHVIYETQLPKTDFNIPFTVKFSTETYIPIWNLTWSNRINVKAGGTVARDTGDNYTDITGTYDIYEDLDFDQLITLDTTFEWQPELFKDVDGYLKLKVNNIFDDYIDASTNSNTYSYTLGRSSTIEVGMRF